jgi:hypothetical protein
MLFISAQQNAVDLHRVATVCWDCGNGREKSYIGCQELNPLNAELNPMCNLLALLGDHPILHVSRIRVKCLLLHSILSTGRR